MGCKPSKAPPTKDPMLTHTVVQKAEGPSGTVEVARGGTVFSAAFAPDGTRFIVGGEDQNVAICDTTSGEVLVELVDYFGNVHAVAFSPDGARVIVSSETTETAVICDATSGESLVKMKNGDRTAAFSPDGARVIIGGNGSNARICDAKGGKVLVELGHECCNNTAVFSPDGGRVMIGTHKRAVICDATSGKVLVQLECRDANGYGCSVLAAAFSSDGARVIWGGMNYKAVICDAMTGDVLTEIERNVMIRAVGFSPDGTRVIIGTGGARDDNPRLPKKLPLHEEVAICDARSGNVLREMEGFWNVNAAAFSPDGARVIVVDDNGKLMICGDPTAAAASNIELN